MTGVRRWKVDKLFFFLLKQNVQAVDEQPLEENLNRALADTTFARGIDEAISVLK